MMTVYTLASSVSLEALNSTFFAVSETRSIRSDVSLSGEKSNSYFIKFGQPSAMEVLSVAAKLNTESAPSNKFLVFPLMLLRSRVIAVEKSHGPK